MKNKKKFFRQFLGPGKAGKSFCPHQRMRLVVRDTCLEQGIRFVIFMAIVDCLGKARSLFEFSLKKIAHSKALLLSALFISPQVHNPVTPHKDLVQSYDKQRIPRMLHYYHSFSSFSFIEKDPGTTTVKLSLFSKKL